MNSRALPTKDHNAQEKRELSSASTNFTSPKQNIFFDERANFTLALIGPLVGVLQQALKSHDPSRLNLAGIPKRQRLPSLSTALDPPVWHGLGEAGRFSRHECSPRDIQWAYLQHPVKHTYSAIVLREPNHPWHTHTGDLRILPGRAK